jgi:hypothetical protein
MTGSLLRLGPPCLSIKWSAGDQRDSKSELRQISLMLGLGRREAGVATDNVLQQFGAADPRRGAGVRLTDAQTNLRVELVKR